MKKAKPERQSRLEILAYQIWEEQGRPDGRHEDHWAEAERRLRSESDASATLSDDRAFDDEDAPGRLSSRQQTHSGQTTQTGSRELDRKPASSPRGRPR